MAELEQIEGAAPAATDPRPRRTGGGRALAALALVVSLAGAGLAGYAGWLAWQAPTQTALTALEAQHRASELRRLEAARTLRTELQALVSGIEQELEVLRQSQAQQRDLIAEASAESREVAPRGWQLAEAEYLIRIANHRLLMERDAVAAENLLALADAVLAEIGPLAYHDVRALLADEMASLRAHEGVDVQGIFLRLEALKGRLDQLPVRLPEYSAPAAGKERLDEAPPASLFGALAERLSGLIRFRRHDGELVRPLLPPQQADYLQMHLRLALDRSQLAALRHDQAIYRASLTAARDWLHRFVDPTRPATGQLAKELDALLAIDLDVQFPDISRSLARLGALSASAEQDAP